MTFRLTVQASLVFVLVMVGLATEPAGASVEPYLQDEVRCTDYRIPMGRRVMVLDDVAIIASGEVVIDGLLLAMPGVSIEIIAPSVIIRGAVRGGDGAHGTDVLEPGRNGGHVLIRAERVSIDAGAFISAGRGGDGGFGASGGAGGNLRFIGTESLIVPRREELRGAEGGTGGQGVNGYTIAARNGGAGGAAGSVSVEPSPLPEPVGDLPESPAAPASPTTSTNPAGSSPAAQRE